MRKDIHLKLMQVSTPLLETGHGYTRFFLARWLQKELRVGTLLLIQHEGRGIPSAVHIIDVDSIYSRTGSKLKDYRVLVAGEGSKTPKTHRVEYQMGSSYHLEIPYQ